MDNLYERIKNKCTAKGVSVSRMCLDTGMSKSTLSSLKRGVTKDLSAPTLKKIADYLETTVSDLLGEEPAIKKEPVSGGDELIEILEAAKERSDLRALFMLAKDTPPDEIKKTISILKAWKDD